MSQYYIVNQQALTIISGPHNIMATEIKKLTRCGNPDILSDLYLAALGVVPEVSPDYDPQTQTYDGVTVTATAVTKTVRALTAEEMADRLTFRQAQVWEQIKQKREQCRVGGVYVQGHWFHSDIDSKLQFVELKSAAEKVLAAGGTLETVMQANVSGAGQANITWKPVEAFIRVPMTVGLALDIVEAITSSEMINFNNAETHRLAMVVASNLPPEDVGYIAPEDYDFTSGWTGSYQA